MSILSIKNMSKSYGKHRVLNDVSFYIDQPKILALVGPNGSGKSTMLNCITNLLHIDSGSIEVLCQSNTDPNIFKEVAYLKDNRILYPYLSGMIIRNIFKMFKNCRNNEWMKSWI